MKIILSVRAFDHDRKVVLRPTSCIDKKFYEKRAARANISLILTA